MAAIGAGMPEVQAHDRARADGVERALHDRVGAGIVVVVRVDVEAEHGAVPRLAGDVEHDIGKRGRAVVGSDGRKNAPGEPESRSSTSRQRTISSSIASRDKREERRVRVRVVRELVTGVGDLLRPRGVRVEPVADDERRSSPRCAAVSTSSSCWARSRSPFGVERQRDAVAVARPGVDERGAAPRAVVVRRSSSGRSEARWSARVLVRPSPRSRRRSTRSPPTRRPRRRQR